MFGYCHNLQLLFWNFSRKISLDKNLLYGKLPWYLNIYLLECCLLYSFVNTFAIFSKSDSDFHWNRLSICVLSNIIDNGAQLKDRELQLLALFLLILLEMLSSAVLECATCSKWVWELRGLDSSTTVTANLIFLVNRKCIKSAEVHASKAQKIKSEYHCRQISNIKVLLLTHRCWDH